ncbi:MAG: hypothetical protein AAFN77_10310 [Planctomycetota bacterium]
MLKTQLNRLLIAVVVINLCFIIGCHRSYYRRQADAEALRLIREKAADPRWNTVDGNIDVDPQSRMFNPFSQDHPPIPPDDASSHQLMYRVDGKEGYPHWHANGDTDAVEAPEWMAYLPVNEKGQVVLTLDRAYQLAVLHSPDLQQQYETLYRSALDVSIERFGFDSQLFSGFNSFLTTQGRFRGGGSSRTTVQSQIGANGGGANLRRLGITGTNFAVGLANTILFDLAGNNTQSATSLIDFSIVQPLLRGAGRERILESLTQSERTLLANVRQLERFKRGFYLNVAIGRSAGLGPNLGGNFLGAPGFGSENPGGFFGLLEQQQRIRNQEINVRQLEGVLAQFREFFDKDRLDAVQLKLFETSVYRQQRSLLDQKTQYQTSLDTFKVQLGLPPDLNVVIEDSFLDRFELISDQINERLIEIIKLREETGAALDVINNQLVGAKQEGFVWPADVNQKVQDLLPFINQAEILLKGIVEEDSKQLEADFAKLESKRNDRIEYLKKLRREINSGRIISSVDDRLFEAKSIPDPKSLREGLYGDGQPVPAGESPRAILARAEILKERLTKTKQQVQNFSESEKNLNQDDLLKLLEEEFQELIPGQLSDLNSLILEISLLQAFSRSNSIEIVDVSIDDEQAIRIAKCMRRDWMNARASLVDNWRNIEFVADQLEAGIDLVLEGDIGNNGDNPFKLRYENGQLRAGFRIDAPITRLAERNSYREALISYQQSRRQFYQFEDTVKQNIRRLVRNIGRNKVRFELDRRTVQVQIENVEINRFELERPVGPNATSSRLGTTTARNLTEAIIGLNSAQNSFVSSWVQYEVLRRNLDFDMGTMLIDDMGQWLDPGEIDSSIGVRSAAMIGFEPDCQFCENIGTSYLPPLSEEEIDKLDSIIDSETESGFDILDIQRLRAGGENELRSNLTPEERRMLEQLNEQRRLMEDLQEEQRLQRLRELEQQRQLELQQTPRPDESGNPQARKSSGNEYYDRPTQPTTRIVNPRFPVQQPEGFIQPIVAPVTPIPPDQSKRIQPEDKASATIRLTASTRESSNTPAVSQAAGISVLELAKAEAMVFQQLPSIDSPSSASELNEPSNLNEPNIDGTETIKSQQRESQLKAESDSTPARAGNTSNKETAKTGSTAPVVLDQPIKYAVKSSSMLSDLKKIDPLSITQSPPLTAKAAKKPVAASSQATAKKQNEPDSEQKPAQKADWTHDGTSFGGLLNRFQNR